MSSSGSKRTTLQTSWHFSASTTGASYRTVRWSRNSVHFLPPFFAIEALSELLILLVVCTSLFMCVFLCGSVMRTHVCTNSQPCALAASTSPHLHSIHCSTVCSCITRSNSRPCSPTPTSRGQLHLPHRYLMLRLSKADFIDICSPAEGIRLHTTLRYGRDPPPGVLKGGLMMDAYTQTP